MRQPSALQFGIPLFCAAIELAAMAVPAKLASAAEPGRLPTLWALQDDARDSPPEPTQRDFSADLEERKSYLIPALEIVGFDALANLANRNFIGEVTQTRGTIGVFHTYLGHDRFGAVDWK